ncbi:MAG: hypothetical protein LBF97_07865 [Elusimicrobiota bacterium]|jgi:hypothetical protein|nr:hypothetical protein [Elusimicrobiota bacterium]
MFENDIFAKWLDENTNKLMLKMGSGEALTNEDMLLLVLKSQSNHFFHLDKELKNDIVTLKTEFAEFKKDVDKRFEAVDKRFDRIHTILMWGFGIVISLIIGFPLISKFFM